MNLLICLVLAAVTASTTTYGQAVERRPNELLDGVKVLADILTDRKFQSIRNDGYDHDGVHDNYD